MISDHAFRFKESDRLPGLYLVSNADYTQITNICKQFSHHLFTYPDTDETLHPYNAYTMALKTEPENRHNIEVVNA